MADQQPTRAHTADDVRRTVTTTLDKYMLRVRDVLGEALADPALQPLCQEDRRLVERLHTACGAFATPRGA